MPPTKKFPRVLRYRVVLKRDRTDGGYVVIVPALPGCISQGDNKAEALKNIREAIELHTGTIDEDKLLPCPVVI